MEWTVLTLGRFSRNRYWGEDETQSYRNPICTSTLIRAEGFNIVVDPALPGPDMEAALDGCTSLKPDQIDAVFITHAHNDHYVGLSVFPNAKWICALAELEAVRATLSAEEALRVQPAQDELVPGIKVIPLPGHTPGLAGLLFDSRDGAVAVVGDAVMTRDFFDGRRGYYNSADQALSTQSIEKLAGMADIVVPGHGNYFIAKR